jgi:hypothetical protein
MQAYLGEKVVSENEYRSAIAATVAIGNSTGTFVVSGLEGDELVDR